MSTLAAVSRFERHHRRRTARRRRLGPSMTVSVRYRDDEVRALAELWSGDVLIVGGGSAGCAAAVAAARHGARTLLVEQGGFLEGTGVVSSRFAYWRFGGTLIRNGFENWKTCPRRSRNRTRTKYTPALSRRPLTRKFHLMRLRPL